MSLHLQTATSPNYAPIKGLQQNIADKAQDRSIEIDPDRWFEQRRDELASEEISTWENEFLLAALIFLVIEGKTLIRKAKYGRGWRYPSLPDRTDLPVYGFNIAGFYSEALKAQWSNSNTDIRWRASRDSDDAQGATRAAQQVSDHLRRQLVTNEFKQTEALYAQCGKYVRYSYVTNKKKSYARRPKIEREQIQLGDSSFVCADCGSGGVLPPDAGAIASGGGQGYGIPDASRAEPMDLGGMPPAYDESALYRQPGFEGAAGEGALNGSLATPPEAEANYGSPVASYTEPGATGMPDQDGLSCPDCGSPNIAVEEAEPFEVERFAGYEEIEVGSIVRETVPVFELKHDTTKSPQDSDYLIRTRQVRLDALQYEYPELQISKSNGDDLGLKMEAQLKRSAHDQRGHTSDTKESPTVDFTQVWLTPCMYANRKLKTDLVTRSGETIPAGTSLGEKFPKGLYMCFISGVKGVIELRNECHKDHWAGTVLRQRAISSLGSGIEDIINGNLQLNLVDSIIFEQLRTSAMPATLFNQRMLPNGLSSYIGSLSNIPVEMEGIEDGDIRKAVYQLQPQPPTQQHFAYGEKLKEHIQRASRVMQFSNFAPNVNNKTATGAEIGNAASQALMGPQLANKAELDRLSAEIELNLWKVHCHDEQYVSLSGRRGEKDGIWLSAASINVDLYAEVVEDSYLPQTNLERRERWDAFLQRVGGLPGLKQALQESPDQVEQLAEIFDVDLAGQDYSVAAQTCRERLDQFMAAAPMVQVMQQGMPTVQMAPDPMDPMSMIAVPVDPMAEAGKFLMSILDPAPMVEEMGHLASIFYLRSWLLEDEGKKAPREVREGGVRALIAFHVDGLMTEGQLTGLIANAGMMPPPGAAGQPNEQKNGKDRKNNAPDAKQTVGAAGIPQGRPAMAGAM